VKKYSLIAALMFSVAGLLVPARAQEAKVIVTVPFEFMVGTETLPAGTYTVSKTSGGEFSALFLASQQQKAYLCFPARLMANRWKKSALPSIKLATSIS